VALHSCSSSIEHLGLHQWLTACKVHNVPLLHALCTNTVSFLSGKCRPICFRNCVSSYIIITNHWLNEPVVDIRLRPGPVLPPSESFWVFVTLPNPCCQLASYFEYTPRPFSRRPFLQFIGLYAKWRHLLNRKYITYRNTARGGPSNSHSQNWQTMWCSLSVWF